MDYKEELFSNLINKDETKRFITKNNISKDKAIENVFILEEYQESIIKCKHCNSLNSCTQSAKKYYKEINANFEIVLVPCNKFKEEKPDYKVKHIEFNNFLNMDIEKDDSFKTVKFEFLQDNELNDNKNVILNNLLKNKFANERIKELNITESKLLENVFNLNDFCESVIKCSKCKKYEDCNQNLKGYYKDINKDVEIVMQACKKFKLHNLNNKFSNNFIVNHIEEKYRNLYLAHHIEEEKNNTKEYIDVMMNIVKNIKENKGKGFYIFGKGNIGKTKLISAVANEYARKNKSVSFINTSLLINDLKGIMKDSTKSINNEIERIKASDILFIDDIGSEKKSLWFRDEILFQIINYRSHRNLITYITSNYDQEDIAYMYAVIDEYDEYIERRFLDRLKTISREKKI